jgi:hypothetical protein
MVNENRDFPPYDEFTDRKVVEIILFSIFERKDFKVLGFSGYVFYLYMNENHIHEEVWSRLYSQYSITALLPSYVNT